MLEGETQGMVKQQYRKSTKNPTLSFIGAMSFLCYNGLILTLNLNPIE